MPANATAGIMPEASLDVSNTRQAEGFAGRCAPLGAVGELGLPRPLRPKDGVRAPGSGAAIIECRFVNDELISCRPQVRRFRAAE
jgi:hypothetical protein